MQRHSRGGLVGVAMIVSTAVVGGLAACESDGGSGGPSFDFDASTAVGLDASTAPFDASTPADARVDAPVDAGADASLDAASDATADAGCVATCGTACTGELCLPKTLIGYWRADGDLLDSAKVVADAAGGNHGAYRLDDGSAGVALFAPGRIGQAFSFDAAGNVEIPSTPAMGLVDGVTLAAWVHPTGTVTNFRDIAGKDGEIDQRQYFLNLTPALRYRAHVDTTAGFFFIDGATTVSVDAWHHVAMTYDAATATLLLYVDGVQDASLQVGTPPVAMVPGSQPFRIGGGAPAPWPSLRWEGLVDEVQLYGGVLTPAEIAALAAGGGALTDAGVDGG